MRRQITSKANLAIILFMAAVVMASCSEPAPKLQSSALNFPPKPDPRGYVCYRTSTPINIDGVPDEKAWNDVPWTDYFVDIEGSSKPAPLYRTHAKMLWDDANLYIAAELEDPHVWATLRQRDTIIFFDNDFEVFIDPDGDTQAYYELEVNAYGTPWDLLLLKPYRNGGPPLNGWNIAGLQVATHVNGTINNPSDIDKGWTVEEKIPLSALNEGAKGLPAAGDKWRIDFSRVEWRVVTENGTYRKEINPATGKPYPEYNWVWSPQGRIDMHMPEMWGFLQFSGIEAGKGTEAFVPDPDLDLKWALRMIYYAEDKYYLTYNSYTSRLEDLGLKRSDFPENLPAPVIGSTRSAFEAYFPAAGKLSWSIYQDGRIVRK
jgi:hypothetical protein